MSCCGCLNVMYMPTAVAVTPEQTVLSVEHGVWNSTNTTQEINLTGPTNILWNTVAQFDELNNVTIAPNGVIDLVTPGQYEVSINGTIEYSAGGINLQVSLVQGGVNTLWFDKDNRSDDLDVLVSIEQPDTDPPDTLNYVAPTFANVNSTVFVDASVLTTLELNVQRLVGGGATGAAIINPGGFSIIIKRFPF